MGITEQRFHRAKDLCGGLVTGELRRLEQREDENHRFKQRVADLSRDKDGLPDVLAKEI